MGTSFAELIAKRDITRTVMPKIWSKVWSQQAQGQWEKSEQDELGIWETMMLLKRKYFGRKKKRKKEQTEAGHVTRIACVIPV